MAGNRKRHALGLRSANSFSDQEQWLAFSPKKTTRVTRMSHTRIVEAEISCSCYNYEDSVETWGMFVICSERGGEGRIKTVPMR